MDLFGSNPHFFQVFTSNLYSPFLYFFGSSFYIANAKTLSPYLPKSELALFTSSLAA